MVGVVGCRPPDTPQRQTRGVVENAFGQSRGAAVR